MQICLPEAFYCRFGNLKLIKALFEAYFDQPGDPQEAQAKPLGLGFIPLTLKGSTALTAQGWFFLHRRSSSPSFTWAARACGQVAR